MSKTVLIVDDAYFMRNLLKKALKEAGYQVIGEAKNGKEGIKLYFELRPDIVTMDINMPDISGVEVTKQILSKDANAKIIAVTGNNNVDIKHEIMEAGAKEYLQKPFQPAFLWSKLDKMLQESEPEATILKKDTILKADSSTPSSSLVVLESIEDDFNNLEIEIMNKPDESKSMTLVIENKEDFIEFPEEYKEVVAEENVEFGLSKENLERVEEEELIELEDNQTLIELKDNNESLVADYGQEEQSIPVVKEPIRKPVIEPPPPPEKPEVKPHVSPKNSVGKISIRPPRGKVLRDEYEPYDDAEVEEPILNVSNKDNYNNKNNGLFGVIKKLFKK